MAISFEQLKKYDGLFKSDPKNRLAQSFVTQHGIQSGCTNSNNVPAKVIHTFNTKVTAKFPHCSPVTNQKGSGRCWIFALLNTARIKFAAKYELGDFEFSQSYLFFWDKVERANYYLNAYIETRDEPVDGRMVNWLLQDPLCDGGQWDMLVNLVKKYGLVPKSVYPETKSTEGTRPLNQLLTNKMREYCMKLRKLSKEGKTVDELHVERNKMMEEIYRICSISLGIPPVSFDWEYTTSAGIAVTHKDLTPQSFYSTLVQPLYDLESKICLIHDPRPGHEFMKLYTVKYLGNIQEGYPVRYINVDIEKMKNWTAESLKRSEAVWFGSDCGKFFERKVGSLDMECFDYGLTFGVSTLGLTKAERLLHGESLMTHAMVITGVHIEGSGSEEIYKRWQVENSWGGDHGNKGYISMSSDWFSEFVFEVVVDKDLVPEEVAAVLKQDPIVLPPWDPMGALAT